MQTIIKIDVTFFYKECIIFIVGFLTRNFTSVRVIKAREYHPFNFHPLLKN